MFSVWLWLAAPWSLISTHRELLLTMTHRDLAMRYRGSVFGVLWSLITPLLLLAVFCFVFTHVFEPRWQGGGGSANFALLLFTGMLLFQFFSECLTRSPTVIQENASLVKKVVFPVQILPLVVVFSSLAHMLVSFLILAVAYVLLQGVPPVTAAFIPVVLVPFLLMAAGIGWCLAALGVYLRDIGQAMGLVSTILMFVSGVFYPVDTLPAQWRALVYLSPATFPIQQVRDLLFWGNMPELMGWGGFAVVAVLVSSLGLSFFMHLRSGFADVV